MDLLCDAAFSIIEFTSTSTDKEALPLSATLQRIVKTISNIVKEEHRNVSYGSFFFAKFIFVYTTNVQCMRHHGYRDHQHGLRDRVVVGIGSTPRLDQAVRRFLPHQGHRPDQLAPKIEIF